ncbi:MAG: hypothetical protein NTY46_04845 [Candidatus Sumerlaeota bacterium]|nr:hypothetical protein [Candidatus Sumerlaeota bacterium]
MGNPAKKNSHYYWNEAVMSPLATAWQRAGAPIDAVPGLLWQKVHEAIGGFCAQRHRHMDREELGDMVADMAMKFMCVYLAKWQSGRGTLFAYTSCYAATKSSNWRKDTGCRTRHLLAACGKAVLELGEGHEPLSHGAKHQAKTWTGLAKQRKHGNVAWFCGSDPVASPDAHLMDVEAARFAMTEQPAGEPDEPDPWHMDGE